MRALLTLTLGLALASCATITLVPPYDEQIDTGLTRLYGDTSGFVDKMIAEAGTLQVPIPRTPISTTARNPRWRRWSSGPKPTAS